jgi:GNAT superfamily N-acetyltransferase
MPHIDVTVSCPVFDSFRVQQVAGMFDVPLARRASERFQVDIADWDDAWRIGLIVGPSGSGKSTIAREIFGPQLYRRAAWPEDRAVIDCVLPEAAGGTGSSNGIRSIKEITRLFTAVGFGSPPSWVKPYHVLSNGEQFRCDLARALAEAAYGVRGVEGGVNASHSAPHTSQPTPHPLLAFDEFTSVVDRNVARAVSAAVARGIQQGQIGCRFVAVTCHYDVADWLEPDWVIDMATREFQRRSLRRPPIKLEIFRCRRSAWKLFARHHYLTGALNPAARCFLALWRGAAVAFCATLTLIGHKGRWRVSRLVTLPDYQGLGIGMAMLEAVAAEHRREGHRVNVTASHPALLAHCRRSPRWRAISVRKTGSAPPVDFVNNYRGSAGRAVVSFEYLGPGQ